MTGTGTLAAFAAGLAFEDVPPDLAAKIALHLLDTVGCGIAGAETGLTRNLIGFAGGELAAGPCRVPGTPAAFGPAGAAFLTSAAMNALDHDDGFEVDGRGMGHPGASLVAAALSAVWQRPVDGRSLIAALAAAYEINARVILSMQPSYERFREVYGVCQHQAIGAAVAYGRLAGLDAGGLENAFGLAGTLAPVPSLRKYNWQSRPLVSFKDFNAPAAEAGVRGVLLHQAGLVGARDVLDGEHGLWRMLGSDRFDAELLTAGLGTDWLARHASFKPFPTCRWMHTALESFCAVRDGHGLAPAEIEAITVHSFAGMARDFMDAAPQGMVDAEFSLPFALAVLAQGERPALQWYADEALADAALLALARRVRVVVDPQIDAEMSSGKRRPAGQTDVTARGTELRGPRLLHPAGTAERPLDAAALRAKFRANLGHRLGPGAADALAEALLDPATADIGAVLAGVRGAAAP